jgi:ribosomal protein S18 acetylase RimI-like enzyme
MDSQVELQPRASELRVVAPAAAMLEPQPDPRVEEARGAVMRRLFPKRLAGRANQATSRVALRVHAYLAEATTIEDLERRLRFPMRYPTELIDEARLRDGRSVLMRPVLPPDASMHRAFVQSMSPATRRNRFHAGVADLPDPVLRYLTEVDHVDHLALVGEVEEATGARLVAEARWVRREDEPDTADFAIAIADDCQHSGLGSALLDMLQRSAAARGIDRLCGHVLRNNLRMSGWLEARGWRMGHDPDDPGVVCAELPLATSAARPWRAAA